jgi:hypothetical protein
MHPSKKIEIKIEQKRFEAIVHRSLTLTAYQCLSGASTNARATTISLQQIPETGCRKATTQQNEGKAIKHDAGKQQRNERQGGNTAQH